MALVSSLIVTGSLDPPATAETPGCDLSAHCYALLTGGGASYSGLGATWNRVSMYQDSSSASDDTFLDSEQWLNTSCGQAWVEFGLFAGYEPDYGQRVEEVFVGWQGLPGYAAYGYSPLAIVGPDPNTIDSYYEYVNLPYGNGWHATWNNGQLTYDTPRVGFASGGCLEQGAEVATPVGHTAGTFNMYSNAYDGSWGPWVTQAPYFSPPSIAGTVLNGVTYSNSEWSWNTAQG